MDYQNCEQEIQLKYLMFAVFHKWRGILLVAVIFAVLLGGYRLSTSLANKNSGLEVRKAKEAYADDLNLYESTKAWYELENNVLKEKIKAQEEYFSSSVLMQISPYKKYTASADVFVKTDIPDRNGSIHLILQDASDSILKGYETVIKRAEGVEVKDNLSPQYLRELITTEVDYEGNVLNISVAYKDEAGAEKILDALLNDLNEEVAEVNKKFGPHNIIVMNEITGISSDPDLVEMQQMYSEAFIALQKALLDNEEASKALVPPNLPSALSASAGLKDGIKYAVLGGVMGAFLTAFFICTKYLLSDKLSSEKELKGRFGIRILGVFTPASKKRMFAGVDRWLDRMEGRSSRKPAEVYEIMAVNVRNYMEADKKILILGSVSHKKMCEIAEELKRRMAGIEIQVGQDMEYYAETLRLLPEAGQIILVEERGQSKYEEIQNQVEVIRSLNKEIIGGIVL